MTILEVNSSINPATFNYLQTNFKKLSAKNKDMVLLKLDTPGGLVSTTKEILTLIGSVDFPVSIWVTPEGASATSAGAIIASSAHYLVMSEGTNIGAATPINLGKDIEQKDAKSKAVNDLVALVTSLSKARGRNPKPFEKMITDAKSYDARIAKEKNIIDAIINTQQQLIESLNNKVITIKGQQMRMNISSHVRQKEVAMDPGQQILNVFANPTTAYVLFIIGAALIYFELQAPGGLIAGSIGVICLFLAGIGFQVLPLNIGAMGLIILSFALFVLEGYITSFGMLTLAGLVSLTMGSLFLFRTDNSFIQLEQAVVFSVVGAIFIYLLLMGWFLIKTYRRRKNFYSNKNEVGTVMKVLDQEDNTYHYQVKVHGEIWNATSQQKLAKEEKVKIVINDDDNLMLKIIKM